MTDIKANDTDTESEDTEKSTRRDFVVLAASAVAGVGAITAAVPFIRSLSPDASVLAVGSTEVDLSNIKEGETITVMWRGKPIFVTKRTSTQIEEARSVNLAELRDPQSDEERVKKGKEQWLITIGVCTHLGCVPVSGKGDYDGWFCPCHGSHYDSSGRIRKGPAPANLTIPPYEFLSDNKIKIG
ncbi:MAG: ubiquinol-cytochrome c reductase iron-sulfur subunit [Candidatus Midichloria sp.]|nr:ubiquinol-cytochrome c reductase iron-sulfur subunit [Candidatus Midichloria sp.]